MCLQPFSKERSISSSKSASKSRTTIPSPYQTPVLNFHEKEYHGLSSSRGVMATNGNSAGFSVLAANIRSSGNLPAWGLGKALTRAARSGSVGILYLIHDGCGAERDQTGHDVGEAVDFGRLNMISHVLCRGGVDVNARMRHFEKGLLLRVMYQTSDSRRAVMVEFLFVEGRIRTVVMRRRTRRRLRWLFGELTLLLRWCC
jgi:hypothetical protein